MSCIVTKLIFSANDPRPCPASTETDEEPKNGRSENPSPGIMDTQSVKGTPESALESGFDGGKLVQGRKRHIVVDTMGYILIVRVHAANIYDGRAAREVLNRLFSLVNTVKKIWADGTYRGEELAQWVKAQFQCDLEVVNKKTGKGFQILPRRWVVERTFAWVGRSRRLSKDYERNPASSASMVYVASGRLMLRRLCKKIVSVEEIAEATYMVRPAMQEGTRCSAEGEVAAIYPASY